MSALHAGVLWLKWTFKDKHFVLNDCPPAFSSVLSLSLKFLDFFFSAGYPTGCRTLSRGHNLRYWLTSYSIVHVNLAASYLLCWGGGRVLGGRSSLCPRPLWDIWLDVDNMEAEPPSPKEPMLETGVTESEPGLTDTAEPAAARKRDISGINSNPEWSGKMSSILLTKKKKKCK